MTSVITSPEEARAWLEGHDLLLCDCDGVLWRGAAAIPQVADAIEKLRRVYGKRVLFVTNNATKSRAQQVEKLAHTCGIAATEDDVLSSAYAAAMWAEQRGLAGRAAYIIGQKGLADELRAVGMTVRDRHT
ncbi:MAG: hypothetical protein EOO65_04010 [Methanosarcinales archaeon]|nr:MAG: hypothetical protein EOO65_04010 [Methanosarcinales archaeon]